jgi:hypothetical protein
MVLIATVGRNPLPVVVAVKALADARPGCEMKTVLLHTGEKGTRNEAGRIAKALDKLGISNVSCEELLGATRNDIQKKLEKILGDKTGHFHLHYTGGYRVMGIWSEEALRDSGASYSSSYLDAGTYKMEISPNLIGLSDQSVNASAVKLKPLDLFELQGYKGSFKEYSGGKRSVTLTWGNGNPKVPFRPTRGTKQSDRLELDTYYRLEPLAEPGHCLWSTKLTPEESIVNAKKIGTYEKEGVHSFELDVVALHGTRLTVVSCTTNSTLSDSKCAEAIFRAKQIGGDAARAVALVNDADAPELAQRWRDARDLDDYSFEVLNAGETTNWKDELAKFLSRPRSSFQGAVGEFPGELSYRFKRVHLVLVGGNPLPSFLGLPKEQKDLALLYVHTEQTRQEACRLCKLRPGYLWQVPRMNVDWTPLKELAATNVELHFDITGGKKNIASSLLREIPSSWQYLSPQDQDRLIHRNGNRPPLAGLATLTQIAELHGFALNDSDSKHPLVISDAVIAALKISDERSNVQVSREGSVGGIGFERLIQHKNRLIGVFVDREVPDEDSERRKSQKLNAIRAYLRMRQLGGASAWTIYIHTSSYATKSLALELADFSGIDPSLLEKKKPPLVLWGPKDVEKDEAIIRELGKLLKYKTWP